jgi:hypothetical protein
MVDGGASGAPAMPPLWSLFAFAVSSESLVADRCKPFDGLSVQVLQVIIENITLLSPLGDLIEVIGNLEVDKRPLTDDVQMPARFAAGTDI